MSINRRGAIESLLGLSGVFTLMAAGLGGDPKAASLKSPADTLGNAHTGADSLGVAPRVEARIVYSRIDQTPSPSWWRRPEVTPVEPKILGYTIPPIEEVKKFLHDHPGSVYMTFTIVDEILWAHGQNGHVTSGPLEIEQVQGISVSDGKPWIVAFDTNEVMSGLVFTSAKHTCPVDGIGRPVLRGHVIQVVNDKSHGPDGYGGFDPDYQYLFAQQAFCIKLK